MVAGGRMRTKPLIPEMCFTTTTEEDSECEEQPVTPHLEEDGTSLLISCSQCSVRVHTSQYTHCWTQNIGCKYKKCFHIKLVNLSHFFNFHSTNFLMSLAQKCVSFKLHGNIWWQIFGITQPLKPTPSIDGSTWQQTLIKHTLQQCVRLHLCVCLFQAVTVWNLPVWARSGNVHVARPTPWLRSVNSPEWIYSTLIDILDMNPCGWQLLATIIKDFAPCCWSGQLLYHMLFAELLFMFTERRSLAKSQQQQVSNSRVIRNRQLTSALWTRYYCWIA